MIKLLVFLSLIACLAVVRVDGKISEIPLPVPMKSCFDNLAEKGNLTTLIGEKVVWRCIHGSLRSMSRNGHRKELPKVAIKWFADLIHTTFREAEHRRRQRRQAINGARRRQRPPLRVRKEYRMLSDAERNNFHRAMLLLKADTSVPPNRFDALGLFHEYYQERSHDGPNFLLWHRMFLVMAENAMREKVPTVTIPYWDSTLDLGLEDPRSSIMWSPAFMGNGNGRVHTGPFANFITPYGPLMRNFGDGGTMMNWTSLRDTFSVKHLAEISYPFADPKANLEDHHGEPHLWVGGYMAPVSLAGFDPVFFTHHGFVDLAWELFRRIQKRRGVDPTTDYPMNFNGTPGHQFNDPSGFGTLRNRHALSDIFTSEIYTYQLPPTCSRERPTCGSPYLRCVTSVRRPRCVPASVFDTPPDQVFDIDSIGRVKRSVTKRRLALGFQMQDANYLKQVKTAAELKCAPENINDHYVNTFVVDGVADPKLWSYIPVNVIVNHKSSAMTMSPNSRPATYPKCQGNTLEPYRVFIESVGINYQGFFKDIVHVEEGALVSSTIAYLGVKSPTENHVEVAVSAYDSCGRICRPFCKSEHGNQFRACPGALRIEQNLPKQYSSSVESMSVVLWGDNEFGMPTMDNNQLFVKFVCDGNSVWPWVK